MATGPLAGVFVVDFSRLLPGPYASLVLAELGAEVVKIEDLGAGDYARVQPPMAADGQSLFYHMLNRGKRSVALDLKSRAGVAGARALIQRAHVLIDSFRPGVMERLGLGPDDVRALRPSLVYCRLSAFGQSHPDAGRAGHDINFLARAGVLEAMPSTLPLPIGDLAAGALPAVVQILAGLRHAERTGRFVVIDVSMTDNCYALNVDALAAHGVGLDDPQRFVSPHLPKTLLSGAVPAITVYPCRDGHVACGAVEAKFWNVFVERLGLPELKNKQLDLSVDNEATKQRVRDATARFTRAELMAMLREIDCCCEVVHTVREAADAHPHMSVDVLLGHDAKDQRLRLPRAPLNMTDLAPPTRPAPQRGQDNALYLRASL